MAQRAGGHVRRKDPPHQFMCDAPLGIGCHWVLRLFGLRLDRYQVSGGRLAKAEFFNTWRLGFFAGCLLAFGDFLVQASRTADLLALEGHTRSATMGDALVTEDHTYGHGRYAKSEYQDSQYEM